MTFAILPHQCRWCLAKITPPGHNGLCPRCAAFPPCSKCGEPNPVGDRSEICHFCWSEANRGSPDVDVVQVATILAALGLAPDTPYSRSFDWGEAVFGKQGAGYRVEILTISPDALPPGYRDSANPWWFHPWIYRMPYIRPGKLGNVEERVVLRWRAWRADRRGFCEMWWNPRLSGAQRFVFSIHEADQSDATVLLALADLWRTRKRPGAKRGEERADRREFSEIEERWSKIVDKAIRIGKKPQMQELAAQIGCDRSHLYRLITKPQRKSLWRQFYDKIAEMQQTS